MRLDEIENEFDLLRYIKGMLNDFDTGVTDQNQSELAIIDLIDWSIKRDRLNTKRIVDGPASAQTKISKLREFLK